MNIYVVIPNWNGADMLAACLQSLLQQTLKASIVVVDNGSKDESVSLIERQFPQVTLIKSTKNLGFAGGVNVGIKYALDNRADAVALFNNDAVADKDWLKNLAVALRSEKTGISTCKFMRDDKKHFDSTGDFYSIRGIPFPRGRNQPDNGQYNEPEDVFGASGGASLYRSSMLKDIGLFDEKFFAYYEDVDISFRAQLAGWKIRYTPSAVAYHMVGATSSGMGSFSHYHSNKNFYFLYIKNMPGKLFWKYLPSFAYQACRSLASSLIHGRIVSWLKAILFVVWKLPSVIKDRQKIQSARKVDTEYIDSLLHHGKPPISPEL